MNANELRKLRQRLGLSQSELAKALGLTRTYISLMETGTRPIERRTELSVKFLVAEKEIMRC